MSKTTLAQAGFSLVELSIVLVILGLLTGGILSGQSLIRAAELRAVTTEYPRYVTAVQTFRDKYFAIPGDFKDATKFWGAADGSTGITVACKNTVGTGTTTCNGDGNGFVNEISYSGEHFRFWQHLANAGLVEGTYTGVRAGTVGAFSSTTANSPLSKLGGGLWHTVQRTTTGNSSIFDGNHGNTLQLGLAFTDDDPRTTIVKPEEAWNIDTKLDDGKPGMGKVIARDSSGFSGTNCSTATASSQTSTAEYNLSNTTLRCVLMFPRAF